MSKIFIGIKPTGAGMWCYGSSNPTIINLAIDQVYGDNPKSIYCTLSSPVIINATIFSSQAMGNRNKSVGVYSEANSNPNIINSIISGHAYGIDCEGGSGLPVLFQYLE